MPPSPAKLAHRIARAVRPLVTIDPPPADVHVDWDAPIPMRDGVTLRANVFRPPSTEAGERVPVIMCAHPYGKDHVPAKRRGRGLDPQYRLIPQPGPIRISAWTGWEGPDPAVWVPRGYAVVNLDLRGSGTSEGTGELLSRGEAEDYAEAIAWAAAQPWSTGRVGLLGVSYLALSQYGVAALRPPALAAICPWEGFTDVYRDFARPGGIRETGFLKLWSTMTRRTSRLSEDLGAQVAARPARDEWYAAHTPDLAAIDVPMLVCGSFSDHGLHTRGSFEAFRRAGSDRRWLYTHRGGKWEVFYGAEASDTQARFLAWALKGEDTGWDAEPPVRLAIHEDRDAPAEVRHEDAWPPADLVWEELPLDIATRRLLPAGEDPDRSSILLETRGDGVALDWTAPRDLDVIGPMALRLHVAAVGCRDVHLFVRVLKLRGGEEVTFEGSYGFGGDPVTHGWQRAAFRELDTELSRPEAPVHTFAREEWLEPGMVVPVDVELRPQATRMRAGEVLRLEVRGTWPYGRNPVTGQFPAGYEPSPKGRFVIHSGRDRASRLLMGSRPV